MNKLTNTLNLNGQEVWLLVNHRGHYDTYQIFANEDDALAASRAQQLGRNALGSRTVYFDALATAFHIPPGFEIQKLQVNRNGTGDQLDDVWRRADTTQRERDVRRKVL
ncbi:hypothetical protein MBLNU230_g7067t1 [Neophaeotheca triangularis]